MTEAVGISRDWRGPEERKMKQCPECDGQGYKLIKSQEEYGVDETRLCRKCHGTGETEDTSDEFDRADDNID